MDDVDNRKCGKQKRSVLTQNKILNTAKTLFFQKGFYNVTTNEIAKVAEISIGTLYHHYSDKDAILSELLERQNEYFKIIFESGELTSDEVIEGLKSNPRQWLKNLISTLISLHENDLDFIKELNVLYYTNANVAKQRDEHTQAFQSLTYEIISSYKDDFKTEDLEAWTIVFYGFITSLVDQTVLFPCPIDTERYLMLGIDMLVEMLERLLK